MKELLTQSDNLHKKIILAINDAIKVNDSDRFYRLQKIASRNDARWYRRYSKYLGGEFHVLSITSLFDNDIVPNVPFFTFHSLAWFEIYPCSDEDYCLCNFPSGRSCNPVGYSESTPLSRFITRKKAGG